MLKKLRKNQTSLVLQTNKLKLDHNQVKTAICEKDKLISLWKKKSQVLKKK